MGKGVATLLGTPKILYNGQQIAFPFRKAEALFYYLLIKRQATRDELVNLLWAEVDEDVAKKNLRNAVYMIRKVFHDDVFLSPQRAVILLNDEIQWEIDVETFLHGEGPESIAAYRGEFLCGLLVKDAENFEEWLFQSREGYRDIYIHKLHREIRKCIEAKNYPQGEVYCKLLMQADEFNEEAYRTLMMIYGEGGQFNKGVEVYHRLVELLHKELSISPDLKTVEVFETLLKRKRAKERQNKENCCTEFFYGRERELQQLNQNHDQFLQGENASSVVILGEAGIGKSRLMERFLKSVNLEGVWVLDAYCYQAEENYWLKPWQGIFQKLARIIEKENIEIPKIWRSIVNYIFPIFDTEAKMADINPVEKADIFQYQVVEKVILNILQKVAQCKKLILCFEDLQWIDDRSLSLLRNLLLEDRNHSLLAIITCRKGYGDKAERFIAEMGCYDLIEKIELHRLNRQETIDFASALLPTYRLTEELKEMMYKETEGNIFFLVEFLNSLRHNIHCHGMSSKMKDVLKSRFFNVSQEGQKILNMASIFFDKVTLGDLQYLSGKNELELMDIIEELQRKCLLREMGEGEEIGFVFTHQKLREYVYGEMSLARRRILHHRAAEFLEKKLENNKTDMFLYSRLIYHFSNGGNKLAALQYSIKNLEEYLAFSHEIFPVLHDAHGTEGRYLYLPPEQTAVKLKELEILLQEVKEESGDREMVKALEISFLHMMGRFYIRQGEYTRGLALIQKMMDLSLHCRDFPMVLKGYRQMIYYCINTQNTEAMETYLSEALKIAEESGEKGEIGILLRLKGLLRIMEGKYKEAEAFLKKAILIFKTLNDPGKYILNIAASYNFIGESKRHQCQFHKAVYYYDKAISICEEKNMICGLTVFYTNGGQAAFDMEDYDKARYYLNKALNLYSQLDALWGRSTANGYAALLLVREGKYEEALQHLIKAEENAQKLKNPYEMGLVDRVKAEISARMIKNAPLKKVFAGYLSKTVEEYCTEAINLLGTRLNCYESKRLEALRNMHISQ
ncbi:AAA family ATPase [Thermotalea metallivorans]|uniref:Bacterial transcriptional activator domain-containing protein n=1 Tax=Thermotalea metallivorans TaxID=520762 RepID=A0A140L7C9_9FIRM|nr:AAA family ATPase [Thermotalea metallivorans]KXG76454.1 hypothetical protein AN619_09850 [Thermotalea metallivorans]